MSAPTLLDVLGEGVTVDTRVVAIEFFVAGKPAPQGSKRHVGGGRMIESSKALGPWREHVAFAAQHAMAGHNLISGAIVMVADFAFPRIQAIRKTTPPHTKKPDLDKLIRALGDALTGVVFVDDSQIVSFGDTRKRYAEIGETPGVRITVRPFGVNA